VSVNIDGEPAVFTTLEYRVRPADLLIHVKHLPGDEAV
jgi:hypothetical protein